MATSSMALSRAGLIDPTKPGTYPVILGEDILNSGDPSKQTVTGIRYNFKPKHLVDKATQRTSILTSTDNDKFDVTFRDKSGGRYVFAGTRSSKGSKYALVFDSKRRHFILHRLDSLFIMNMVDTPTNHDAEALKKKHPHIDINTKRPRPPRGAVPLIRRPPKKSGPLRPMPKPLARPAPKTAATILRNSSDISKRKEKKTPLSVGQQKDHERETKAAKEVREKREGIIAKEARDNRDARDKAAKDSQNKVSSSSSSKDGSPQKRPPATSTAGTKSKESGKLGKDDKSRDKATSSDRDRPRDEPLASRPKPKSGDVKTKDTAKALPPSKDTGRGNADGKLKDTKGADSKQKSLDAKPKASPSKAAEARAAKKDLSAKDANRLKETSSARKDGRTKDASGKAGRASDVGSSGKAGTKAKQTTKKNSAPPPLPMPDAPSEKPKKKRDSYDEEDDDDDDGGDIGLVIEYPEGPATGSSASHAGGKGTSSPAVHLHMRTFDEFKRSNSFGDDLDVAGSDDDMDGFWDPSKDEEPVAAAAATASSTTAAAPRTTTAPVSAPAPVPPASSAPAPAVQPAAGDDDEIDELEEALMAELQQEEERKRQAEMDAELERDFMAESESEISEEE